MELLSLIILFFSIITAGYCKPNLSICAGCNLYDKDTSFFEEKLLYSLECLKKLIKHGSKNSPSYDPWKWESQTFEIEEINFTLNLLLEDWLMTGLSNFEVDELSLNSETLEQKANITFPHLRVTANYNGEMNYFGLIDIYGEGTLELELTNAKFETQLQYQMTPPLFGKLTFSTSLEELNIHITGIYGDEEASEWFSKKLRDEFFDIFNEEPLAISEILSPLVVDAGNKYFGDMTFVDFLAYISALKC